jgi:RHS repeat-associated protein
MAGTDRRNWQGYSYDVVGRPQAYFQCTGDTNGLPAACGVSIASYDLIGDVTSLAAPDGFTVNYTYDQAGRILSVKDSNGVTYANNIAYAANGSVTGIPTPNFTYNYVYNNRFQPTQIAIGSPTASLLVKDYAYNPGNDNGDVFSVTDENDSTRTVTFNYDTLNRLNAVDSGSATCHNNRHGDFPCLPGQAVWAESFSYDDWGNLTAKNRTGGLGEQTTYTVDATNRLSQYINQAGTTLTPRYDAAGDILNDGVTAYSFDGWNRLLSAGGTTYTYAPSGARIGKSDGTLYQYGPTGQMLREVRTSPQRNIDYVYLGSKRLARVENSNVQFYLADALGSTNKLVDQGGKVLDDQEYFPFGGTVPGVGSTWSDDHMKFTGQERDAESGLDDFGARFYSNALGRWTSPDWSDVPAAVPYATPGNPQTLNLYSYTGNNPTSFVDEGGHNYASYDGFNADRSNNGIVEMGVEIQSGELDWVTKGLLHDNIQSDLSDELRHMDPQFIEDNQRLAEESGAICSICMGFMAATPVTRPKEKKHEGADDANAPFSYWYVSSTAYLWYTQIDKKDPWTIKAEFDGNGKFKNAYKYDQRKFFDNGTRLTEKEARALLSQRDLSFALSDAQDEKASWAWVSWEGIKGFLKTLAK